MRIDESVSGRMNTGVERVSWALQVDAGVGPLRFGMSSAEVAAALHVSEPQSRAGGPFDREDYPDGVKTFYDEDELVGVALDAVMGPQAFFAGFSLNGSDPRRGREYFLDYCRDHDRSGRFTPDASFVLLDSGVVLREQQVGGVRLTRPLFVTLELMRRVVERDSYELPLEGVTD